MEFSSLVSKPHPGPGKSPPKFTRTEKALIVAVLYLQHYRKNKPAIRLRDLLAGRPAGALNSWGDASGFHTGGLELDKDSRNNLLVCDANDVRCAHFINAHPHPSEPVCLFLGTHPGCDMRELIKNTPEPAAPTQDPRVFNFDNQQKQTFADLVQFEPEGEPDDVEPEDADEHEEVGVEQDA